MRKLLFVFLGVFFLGVGFFLYFQAKHSVKSTPTVNPSRERVRVVRVVDGDTIELKNGKKLRYIGVDTPETVDPRKPVQCFGKEASLKNKEFVEGKEVELEKDVSETDRYGRLLRYVFVDDPSTASGQIFVNEYLVRQGYAHAATFPPDVRYQELFKAAEQEARENSRELWSACPVT